MKTKACMMSLALLFALGCGRGEDEPPEEMQEPQDPPVLGERPIMVAGAPADEGENNGMTASDYPRDDPDFGMSNDEDLGDDFCCVTRFAVADPDGMEDEVSVVLTGDAYPLTENPALTYSDGVWSVDVCVPPEYNGSYAYLFSREIEGEVVEELVINAFAPTDGEGAGTENIWLTADDCEGSDITRHALTSAEME